MYYYGSFYFIYKGFRIPCQFSFPDDIQMEKLFQFSYGGEIDRPKINFGFDIETYIPRIDESSKMFKGNRIKQFTSNVVVGDGIEQVIVNRDAVLSGRIMYLGNAQPMEGNVKLINSKGVFIEETKLEDGYYLFTNIFPRIGYKIEDSANTVLKKAITLIPGDDKILDIGL